MIDKNVPRELIAVIRQRFDEDERIIKLRVQMHELQARGNLKEALELGKKIEDMYHSAVANYLKSARQEVEHIDAGKLGMTAGDGGKVLVCWLVLFMAADVIESAIMDMNDVFHKYDKGTSFEAFDDMRQLLSLSKGKLKYLKGNSDYMHGMMWANKCDNIYEIMRSKAKSIIRKAPNDKNAVSRP